MPPSGDLYIRYSATDHGDRDIPAGTDYYLSPAIEIIGSGLALGIARADIDQTVRVYVGNKGANAHTDVNVQVYCTDWGTSSGWMQSLGGPAGREVGPLTVVGNAKWDTNSEGVFDVNWHPVAAELDNGTAKHVCLFANVYRPDDGEVQPNPPNFSDIPTNQHHAQRNITLAGASLGSKIRFILWATSLVEEGGVFLLEVAETRGRLDRIDARQLAGTEWLSEAQDAVGKKLPLHKRPADLRLEAEGQEAAGSSSSSSRARWCPSCSARRPHARRSRACIASRSSSARRARARSSPAPGCWSRRCRRSSSPKSCSKPTSAEELRTHAACASPLVRLPARRPVPVRDRAGRPARQRHGGATRSGSAQAAAITQSTTDAMSVGEPATTLPVPAGCARMGKTVWFSIRGNGHDITVSTAGSAIDTVLAIYDGSVQTCNDNFGGTNKSSATVSTLRGNTYLVQVGGRVDPQNCSIGADSCATAGSVTVTASGSPRPADDDRAAAQSISTGVPATVNNTGATSQTGELLTCGASPFAATVWFSWTAPAAGVPIVDASAAFSGSRPADTVLTVYRASDGAVLGCNDDASTPAGALRVTLSGPVTAGE